MATSYSEFGTTAHGIRANADENPYYQLLEQSCRQLVCRRYNNQSLENELRARTTVPLCSVVYTESPLISSSAVIIGTNEDLLAEILSRIPVKSVCRFRCVSKLLNSLISTPQFRLRISCETCKRIAHLIVHCPNLDPFYSEYDIVQLCEGGRRGASVSKSLIHDEDGHWALTVLHSCHGLLCCRADFRENGWCENSDLQVKANFYICNPTTRQFKKLPNPLHGVESDDAVYLAFDPRKSDHFKVLYVYSSPKCCGAMSEVEIYSSETGQWRRMCYPFSDREYNRPGIYWNGAINWAKQEIGAGLYLNVEEERLGKFPMPPLSNGDKKRDIIYFGESYDHLLLVALSSLSKTQFYIYEMDTGYSGWFVRYHIDLEVVLKAYLKPTSSRYNGLFQILSIVYGGINEDSFVILLTPEKVTIRYNLVNGKFKKIGTGPSLKRWQGVFQYIESLCTV